MHDSSCFSLRIVVSIFYAIFYTLLSVLNAINYYKQKNNVIVIPAIFILCCSCSKNLPRSQSTDASWFFFLAVLIAAICHPVLPLASNSS
jgi:hypothetical protein